MRFLIPFYESGPSSHVFKRYRITFFLQEKGYAKYARPRRTTGK